MASLIAAFESGRFVLRSAMVGRLDASWAALLAVSLPMSPMWPGIHAIFMFFPMFSRSVIISCMVWIEGNWDLLLMI